MSYNIVGTYQSRLMCRSACQSIRYVFKRLEMSPHRLDVGYRSPWLPEGGCITSYYITGKLTFLVLNNYLIDCLQICPR